jgi:hypothetical protein
MSGTSGTVRTIDDLLYAFRDNPPPKSIKPQTVRDLVATLAARAGVTSVAAKKGPVQLTHNDFSDRAQATANFAQRVASGTSDPVPTTGQGTKLILYTNTATRVLWMNVGTPQTRGRLSPPPPLVVVSHN